MSMRSRILSHNTYVLALAMTSSFALFTPTIASATPGLTESVWHNIPAYSGAPTSADITTEQTYTASTAAAYTFVNTNDSFNYTTQKSTIGAWFGKDAAGAALTDTNSTNSFAFDASGYIYVPVAGTYTFNLGNTFNQVDDAARITVDGTVEAEQDYYGTLMQYKGAVNLAAGYHAFDLFYLQTGGGFNLVETMTNPSGGALVFTTNAVAVPEPSTWAIMFAAFVGLLAVSRQNGRKDAPAISP